MVKLTLVTGITGSLGEAYLKYFQNSDNLLVGISRKYLKIRLSGVQYYQADLLDSFASNEIIGSLPLEDLTKIELIHPVGKFKFEENVPKDNCVKGNHVKGNYVLDPDIYASNFTTFVNIVEPLLEGSRKFQPDLTLVGFGSISDKFDVPYWRSYTESKNALREYIKELTKRSYRVKGRFFNLSSVKTRNESKLRPFADSSYWLTPEEIVLRSVPKFVGKEKWEEIDIFNQVPSYSDDFYTDHNQVLKRWKFEMYGI